MEHSKKESVKAGQAVVLAGGKEKNSLLEKLGYCLLQIPYFAVYQKIKIPSPYKCFIRVGGYIEGVYKRRPTIEYILHALDSSQKTQHVAVVTNTAKFHEKLDVSIKNYMKKCILVEQEGTITQNALTAYRALKNPGYTLFLMGDSPQTTARSIDSLLKQAYPYQRSHDIIIPLVSKKSHYKYDKVFRRKYFWIEDDITRNSDPFKKKGKRGFRLTSMLLANPEKIGNSALFDFLYDIRNISLPQNMLKAYATFKPELQKMLFPKKGKKLTLSDMERKLSELLDSRVKFIELDDAGASLDIDDVGDEKRIEKTTGY